jgi:hypothetical protein
MGTALQAASGEYVTTDESNGARIMAASTYDPHDWSWLHTFSDGGEPEPLGPQGAAPGPNAGPGIPPSLI